MTSGEGKGGTRLKRLMPLAGLAVCAMFIASSAPAGALNNGLTPGHLSSSGFQGYGEVSDGNTDFSAQFISGLVTFRPRKPTGPLIVSPDTNLVNLTLSSGGTSAMGCWLIPPSEIVVKADLSATLSFDTADPRVTPCPGDPVGITALGAVPGRPADGLVHGFVGRLTATVTWTPSSPLVANRSSTEETCGQFGSTAEGVSSANQSTISASVTGTVEGWNYGLQQAVVVPVDAQLTGGLGDMSSSSYQLNVHGPATGTCGQFGAQ